MATPSASHAVPVVGEEGGVGLPAGGLLAVAGVPEMHLLHDAGVDEGGHLEVVELAGGAEGVRDRRLELARIDLPFRKRSMAVSVSM